MEKTQVHIYPSLIDIQYKFEKHFELSAEEELLYFVSTGQYDKEEAYEMLQKWFPQEAVLPLS